MISGPGTPTYNGEFFVEIKGGLVLKELTDLLNVFSVFYVVEPQPDDYYRVFVKEEYATALTAAGLEAETIVARFILEEINKLKDNRDKNENYRGTEASPQ